MKLPPLDKKVKSGKRKVKVSLRDLRTDYTMSHTRQKEIGAGFKDF